MAFIWNRIQSKDCWTQNSHQKLRPQSVCQKFTSDGRLWPSGCLFWLLQRNMNVHRSNHAKMVKNNFSSWKYEVRCCEIQKLKQHQKPEEWNNTWHDPSPPLVFSHLESRNFNFILIGSSMLSRTSCAKIFPYSACQWSAQEDRYSKNDTTRLIVYRTFNFVGYFQWFLDDDFCKRNLDGCKFSWYSLPGSRRIRRTETRDSCRIPPGQRSEMGSSSSHLCVNVPKPFFRC